MKKFLLLLCLILGSVAFASQRIVVAEEFTATWCTYCPGAARALDELYKRGYDSLVVIAYHSSSSGDPYYSAEAASRATYYSLTGYPTSWFDGILSEVGGLHYGTMYPFFRHHVTTRLLVSSPLVITMTCTYDSIANTGTVDAIINNPSASSVSGTLHFVIVESDIPYNWQGMTKLDFVMRDMLPDANGEAVTIPAGGNISRSRNFTINTGWNENNCKTVAFVQASDKSIYQGAEVAVMQKPKMEYFGLTFGELSGNINRYAQPGENIRMYLYGKNNGDGTFSGTASVTCSDPYVSITSSNPQTVVIGPGDVDTFHIIDAAISASCPSPHTAPLTVDFGIPGDTCTFYFIVTNQPGFFDNIESGQGNWTHSGISDNWHISSYKSHSPSNSWYSGVESNHQYTNENDASLISPYFVVTPDSALRFWHQYFLEPSWDYAYCDINNNRGWWQTLAEYNGTQSSWAQATYALTNYSGQTVRLRFRFVSDNSTVAEGWYVDDIGVPVIVGVEESNENHARASIMVYPNPAYGKTQIQYNLGSGMKAKVLKIYDATGRLVKSFTELSERSKQITWQGVDNTGRRVSAGVYIIKLETETNEEMKEVILLK
jgi:thiol-disulfide isomerase/thioredoxin